MDKEGNCEEKKEISEVVQIGGMAAIIAARHANDNSTAGDFFEFVVVDPAGDSTAVSVLLSTERHNQYKVKKFAARMRVKQHPVETIRITEACEDDECTYEDIVAQRTAALDMLEDLNIRIAKLTEAKEEAAKEEAAKEEAAKEEAAKEEAAKEEAAKEEAAKEEAAKEEAAKEEAAKEEAAKEEAAKEEAEKAAKEEAEKAAKEEAEKAAKKVVKPKAGKKSTTRKTTTRVTKKKS